MTVGNLPASPKAGPAPRGVLAGPFALAKERALRDGGSGVRLIRDYDTLPLLLVTIRDRRALARLAASRAVTHIAADARNTPG